MEVLVVGFCVVILVYCIIKVLHLIWWKPKMIEKQLKRNGIHGRPHKLFYGNIKEIMKLAKQKQLDPSQLPHDFLPHLSPFLQEMAITHKRAYVIWFGPLPRVTIMDPKMIREILFNKHGEFRKIEINQFTKLFLGGLVIYDGDKWVKHRKIINPAFHVEKLKLIMPAFLTSCEELIEQWDKLVASNRSCELDVSIEFQNLTGDVISRAAFGSNIEEGRSIFLLLKEQGQLFSQRHFNLIFPWLRLVPTEKNRRMGKIHKEVQALVRGIIEKRKKGIRSESYADEDLLGLLLKANLDEIKENNNSEAGLTTEEVIEECMLFYFAGQETTANLLTWSMFALSMHKHWQQKAREEVLQIVDGNKPTFDHLIHLKMVNMILVEVLRLYPPASILRRTVKETKVGDVTIPSGVHLYIPLHLVHRDPEHWGEAALEFDPERFSQGISNVVNDQASYLPFGGGPRICVGQNFAMLEAKLALCWILQHFSFELSPTYKHEPSLSITLKPQYGAQIILHKIWNL